MMDRLMKERRNRMAQKQSQLLRSLVGNEPVPINFNPERVELCARTLQNKRLRTITRMNGWMEKLLGERLKDLFAEYLKDMPSLPADGANKDAQEFIEFLRKRGAFKRENWLHRLASLAKEQPSMAWVLRH